jgi:hypothetical protein
MSFKPGDRVEVIRSDGHYTAGQQGTVRDISGDLVFVQLDHQPELPGAVTVIDFSGDKAQVKSAFLPSEIRHVVTPSA